jgi:hypothetical protein
MLQTAPAIVDAGEAVRAMKRFQHLRRERVWWRRALRWFARVILRRRESPRLGW